MNDARASKTTRQRLSLLLPISVIMILAWIIGLGGVDFGQVHWDEKNPLLNLARSFETDDYLPQAVSFSKDSENGFYGYPSMIHLIGVLTAAPDILKGAPPSYVFSVPFRIRIRSVFYILSSLALLWVYLAVLELGGTWLTATTGAALLLGSWEFIYHARWLATDALCAQFCALALWFAIRAVKTGDVRWLVWSAATAGAAASTKYTAGALILIPGCGLAVLGLPPSRMLRAALRMLRAFVITFVVVTPGAVLQPKHLLVWMKSSQQMYGTGFGPYTVSSHLIYAERLIWYVGAVVWSPVALMGLIVLLAGIWGGYRVTWRYKWMLVVYPVAFLMFLCSQKVLIVRNSIHVLPAIAILAAIGAWRCGRLAKVAEVVLLSVAGIGLMWQFVAMESIRSGAAGATASLVEFVKGNPQFAYRWSPRMREAVQKIDPGLLKKAQAGSGPTRYVMYSDEDQWLGVEANRGGVFEKDFGPYDVNLTYYPTWLGRHVVLLTSDSVRRYPPISFDESIASMQEIGGPVPSRRDSAARAAFIQLDTKTAGTWKGIYGGDGFAVAGDSAKYPSYAQVSFEDLGGPVAIWAGRMDERALQRSSGDGRVAAALWAFRSFKVKIAMLDGKAHDVALYCLDWDRNGRSQKLDVLDAATGKELDSRTLASFQNGGYVVWRVDGAVVIRVTPLIGNAVVSGLFFGNEKSSTPLR